ncbi:MAG TPA: threonine--tRNA ligase [Firmicutes bacterium]|nr:threonine--tRNA ligase [Bacillota bacterium]
MTVKITLPDGSVKEYPRGITAAKIAEDISPRLAKDAVAARVSGVLKNLKDEINEDSLVEIITVDQPEGLEILRHSAAHIMAEAVKRLYPDAKLAIGPAIENGFYYDFDVPEAFSPEDLERIEAEMRKIVEEDQEFSHWELDRETAVNEFSAMGEVYKVELLREMEDGQVSIYKQGDFVDLCRGPHIPSTGKLKAFKLLNVAGAYWRGDSNRPMLQRIYGTAFAKKKDLDEYLQRLEEAARRDHRRLGKELDLFSIQDEGPGFPFLHPNGMVIWRSLEDFWRREHRRRGYQEVKTPMILSESLWRRSGHWDHYRENMYFTEIDGRPYAIKPMNCPGSILLYKRRLQSYRDLPLRYCELGLVHRHELSGTLHGLMRVRCFHQDDAHIFMLPSQIQDEIAGVIDFIDYVYRGVFGLNYRVELSTKPEDAMGPDEIWEAATDALRNAVEAKGMPYEVNEGDGAFYGPKLDFHLEDCLGRTWQCGTIQLDFLMPERFDLTYVGEDGKEHRPVMIHRVIFGALERFIGILIEEFAGAFPAWLAPVQARVIPVGERFVDYATEVQKQLLADDLRVDVDVRDEKVGYKIRSAQLEKIPYMLIVGEKEVEAGTVSVRHRQAGDLGSIPVEKFRKLLREEVASMSLKPLLVGAGAD